jgi:SAM-dependent methyltransferase
MSPLDIEAICFIILKSSVLLLSVMYKSIVERILKLNSDFYQSTAVGFSGSRQLPWKGWFKILEFIRHQGGPAGVIDLGCGNARFYSFLKDNYNGDFKYLGLDKCEELLKIAHAEYGKNRNFNKKKCDVIKNISTIKNKFGTVAVFGLTHHIPSAGLRNYWFDKVGGLVNKDGLLVITFWYPQEKNIKGPPEIKTARLDDGDCYLGWGNRESVFRYVHVYSEQEIARIIKQQKRNGLILISSFKADDGKKSDNLYLVFRRIGQSVKI